MNNEFAHRVRHILRTEGLTPALQSGGVWYRWSEFDAVAVALEAALAASQVAGNVPVALILRNRPAGVAGLLGLAANQRPAVLVSPLQPTEALRRDLEKLKPAVIAAESQDWTEDLASLSATIGAVGLELHSSPARLCLTIVRNLDRVSAGTHCVLPDDVGIVIPTSGTTGPAKRIPLHWQALRAYLANDHGHVPPEKRRTTVIAAPLVTITGLGPLLSWATRPLKLGLMERLDVRAWAALVHELRPKQAGLPPAAMRMMLDSDILPEQLSSLECWYTGAAPLDPAITEAFEARFLVPVLQAYGATEFGGAVAGWTLADHRDFAARKRGSAGRVYPGWELRIVDPESEAPVAPNNSGIIEVRMARTGAAGANDWVRTNDLAQIDEDGFLYIAGRADDVIIRGGFKVPMFEVARVIEEHPAVKQAAGVGLPDIRLGEVPAIAVTLKPGVSRPSEAELIAWARARLAPYNVPVLIETVDELPTNASMKVSRPLLRELLDGAAKSRRQ
jgi:long-chain acyl-CoA synthetase